MSNRSRHEREYIERLISRLQKLSGFLEKEAIPNHETTLEDWHRFLSGMKAIVGNGSNDMSFIAALMAKDYLCASLPMVHYDAGLKPQGAPGLDVDERTKDGRRVIGEIKTTTPYNGPDLGAQQKAMFSKDFDKLNAANAPLKYFFVTDRATFLLMQQKYHVRIPRITVVLLPEREVSAALL